MSNRITVLPAAGRVVPDPEAGDLLPPEGREVPDSAWWRRRLTDGDITLKTATAKPKGAK
ncbi:DUF2635 domain-containing protein [Pseudomonas granadensis]|uniref:DUF2635 domain-containing protein n=1 Tax=Pseudomonas granadensis TaxID=1421430 RepID=UPI00087CEC90|nr:DUF2635 domain-containing protein [Pseudomonas granadensis]MBN6775529.1 DUF2635 domain-containing protein [Pseudomonas granadensis]MBN6806822.1 DUF2635 domain-containing protein [Pseudomonas granadensis]MBN6833521.1 DUF2635 domain-containing protein [Pseudomonas granadensis]MBN6841068.1 DUF2635 domain-containing protein [Pseudomonas granadensis]MBN6866529.1 DUF2635 domain-containing protein [Pseudomonas granadensis]